jgi:TorA maturation chaperone TorD
MRQEQGEVSGSHWELLRALGAVADSPQAAAAACAALGLAAPSAAGHTEVFMLNCPPHASVYLGAEGGLGGEAADRAAGFWRALGLTPPAEPDHLSALLSLYASLGEAAAQARRPATAGAFTRARRALLTEHLWPWLPGYLDAVAGLGTPVLAAWAELAAEVLAAEVARDGQAGGPQDGPLPLALRAAPPPLTAGCSLAELAVGVTTPVRSGMILTRRRLAAGAGETGAGHRIGERRFTVRAMLEQAPEQTLNWLAGEAGWWQRRHAARAAGGPAQQWWAQRAAHTQALLAEAAAAAAGAVAAS